MHMYVFLAVSQNRSEEKVKEAIEAGVKIFGKSLRSGKSSHNFYPNFSCDDGSTYTKWTDGKELYR